MSFLQPMLLAALPLVALPIIIHLINQRRYQTVQWGAMMFLLAANRMSRGYARVRQWLIMAMRMAAVAGLIFAVSRPLSGGWLGVTAGGRVDTTIILLDRSPSMQQVAADARGSKLETGVRQLAATLKTLGSARWVLIDSNSKEPRELQKIDDLLTTPSAAPASASADVPSMLLAALNYVKANKAGRTEIWIVSDIRENDWNATSGRWQALREGFGELPQSVHFHLLAYPQTAINNLSIRVTEIRRQKSGDAAELLFSLQIKREGGNDAKESVPVQFEIDGARSELVVELTGAQAELKDHRIPLEKGRERGWGRVSVPADTNLADNDFWFVFEQPAPRGAIVVADDPAVANPLQLAASIAPDPLVACSAEVVAVSQLASVDWGQISLVLWAAPLPDSQASKQVEAFVDRGGSVIFFPTHAPAAGEIFGVRYAAWVEKNSENPVENWRGDEDLLAHTASGQPLLVGQLQIRKYCNVSGGELTPLASLRGGIPLLVRVTTNRGAAYFCTTTPAAADSSLASNGVVFYVLVQRAMALGAAALGNTRQLTAGDTAAADPTAWKRIAGGPEALSTEYPYYGGIYQDGDRLFAVNRSVGETTAPVLADGRVDQVFQGLDFTRVNESAGSMGSLIQEIWRLFLVAMMVAMVAEAGLCLPKLPRAGGAAS